MKALLQRTVFSVKISFLNFPDLFWGSYANSGSKQLTKKARASFDLGFKGK